MNEGPKSLRKVDSSKIIYSLDVLTDGSENTGHGTVFLTAYKKSINDQDDGESFPSNILARYALSGMSPLSGRLSSDQNFKLSPVRAVFLPTVKNVAVTAGIPSLLLSLSNFSMTGSLYVVGDDNTDYIMDRLADLILPRRAYPKVFSCVVPNEKCWWKVYDDEYVMVHAQMIQTSFEMVAYLIDLKEKNFTFAIVPPVMYVRDGNWNHGMFHNLPLDVTTKKTDSTLDLLLYLDPVKSSSIPPRLKNLATYHLATLPNTNYQADSGLLVRATQNANALHSLLPSVFLFYTTQNDAQNQIPVGKIKRKQNDNFVRIRSGYSVKLFTENDENKKTCLGLKIVNRLGMIHEKSPRAMNTDVDYDTNMDITKFYFEPFVHMNQQLEDENEINLDEFEEDCSIPFQEPEPKRSKPNAGRTIFEHSEFPLLAVLGTGCASPSPLRNSSGKAIFLPSVTTSGNIKSRLSIVLECGEGFLTMLRRQIRTVDGKPFGNLADIRLIWISHSHLDHYSDLPLLLSSIRKSRGLAQVCICYDKPGLRKNEKSNTMTIQEEMDISKHDCCARCQRLRLPILIAPSKVLKFVDIFLGTKNGVMDNEKLFVGITHRDFEYSPFVSYVHEDIFGMELMGYGNFPYRPICALKNIPVEHCPNSYGVLLALTQMNIKYPTFTLCYSGDTRPSENLVNACIEYGNYAPKTESRVRMETKSNDEYKISLLIHEATFDDDNIGQQEAIKKRHSTVREALDISNQIKAKSLILTHFSQRYPKLPPSYISKEKLGSKPNNDGGLKKSIVSAYDGMILPLRPDLQRVLPLIESVLLQSFESDDEKK